MSNSSNDKTYAQRFADMTVFDRKLLKVQHQVAEDLIKLLDAAAKLTPSATTYKQFSRVTELLKLGSETLKKCEFLMQELWGFDLDERKHRWWLKPQCCTCPKEDNVDPVYYGRGPIINASCPIHGDLQRVSDVLKYRETVLQHLRTLELTLQCPSNGTVIDRAVWYSDTRVDRDTVPPSFWVGSLRYRDDDDSVPATLEETVGVNFYGDVICEAPIDIGSEKYLKIVDWGFAND